MQARFSHWRLRTYWWLLAIVLFVAIRLASELWTTRPEATVSEGVHRVDRVIDGDTLRLASGVRVRLQGIDAPETVRPDHPIEPWGPEASEFSKRFIEDAGGKVALTFTAERLDQYGRYLAFVWHGDRLLNEELVRSGLARARLGYRYSGTMKRRLAAAQDEARSAGRGIWSTTLATPPLSN